MQDFIFFLGRFHVLVLHLPIGIVVVAVALDWAAKREPYRHLAAVAPFLWGTAALSSILTVVLGYMHFAEGSFAGASANAHRLYGTSVAVVCVLVWLLCWRRAALYARANVATGVAVLALLTLTGHYGGNLTHGSTYLIEYAPGPLRTRGEPQRATSVGPAARSGADSDGVVADPAGAARLSAAGFLVRQVSQSDPRLLVSVYSPGSVVDGPRMSQLLTAADRIVELNLQDAGVEDAGLAEFARFSALTHLRLSGNRITDHGVAALAGLPRLEHLNLYGNPGVTDASLEVFARIESLRELYVWQTGVTSAGVAALRERRPELSVDAGAASTVTE